MSIEIGAKIFFGIIGLLIFGLIVGFLDVWGEQRKRQKNNRKGKHGG